MLMFNLLNFRAPLLLICGILRPCQIRNANMTTRSMELFISGPTFTICEYSAMIPRILVIVEIQQRVSFGNLNLNYLRINSVRYGDRQWAKRG